jgi:hypothetical protein
MPRAHCATLVLESTVWRQTVCANGSMNLTRAQQFTSHMESPRYFVDYFAVTGVPSEPAVAPPPRRSAPSASDHLDKGGSVDGPGTLLQASVETMRFVC